MSFLIASGEEVEAQRPKTWPLRSTRNFYEQNERRQCDTTDMILDQAHLEVPLDPRQTQLRLLALQVLEDNVGIISIDVRLLHKLEGHSMVDRAELHGEQESAYVHLVGGGHQCSYLGDLLITSRFLLAKLIRGKANNYKAFIFEVVVEFLEPGVLRGKTTE